MVEAPKLQSRMRCNTKTLSYLFVKGLQSTKSGQRVALSLIHILLKFENKRPDNVNGQMICLQSPYGTFAGQIQDLSSVRDTLERQEALCRFKPSEIKSVENQTVDFQIVHSSGNLLRKMLGGI